MVAINAKMIYLPSTLLAKVGSAKPPCACPGAGWRALTQCSILPYQALGLTPEQLLCMRCFRTDVFFPPMGPLDSLSFPTVSYSGVGRNYHHRKLAWSFIVFYCWLLLPCVQHFGVSEKMLPSSLSCSQEPV